MASSVRLHPRSPSSSGMVVDPLPQLIQTPSGLAILELQGTINLPETNATTTGNSEEISVGRISFPDYNADALDPSNTSWMKTVHLFVGQHQRLTGEVKKLPKALAVIRKRNASGDEAQDEEDLEMMDENFADLEVVEIVKYKIVFSTRPEPVGSS